MKINRVKLWICGLAAALIIMFALILIFAFELLSMM